MFGAEIGVDYKPDKKLNIIKVAMLLPPPIFDLISFSQILPNITGEYQSHPNTKETIEETRIAQKLKLTIGKVIKNKSL